MLKYRDSCFNAQSRSLAAPNPRARPRRATRVHSVLPATQVRTSGLVLGCGEPGSWDEAAVGSAVIRCYLGDDEQRWVMWYSGRSASAGTPERVDAVAPSSGSIGVAISSNGVDWLRGAGQVTGERGESAAADVGLVLAPNKDWWWFDTCHLQVSDVQILSNSSVDSGVGVFWMLYNGGDYNPVPLPPNFPGASSGSGLAPSTSGSGSGPESPLHPTSSTSSVHTSASAYEGLRLLPGLAMSQDGRNWARIESEHHSGALFDVGAAGEWDAAFIGTPQLVAAGPRDMRLFYHSFDQSRGRFVVGLATSPDGFRWTKQGIVFDPLEAATAAAGAGQADPAAHDALGATAFHVVRDVDNKQYVMFYEAVAANNRRSIGLAVSKDGRSGWKRCPYPVFTASAPEQGMDAGAGAWDQGAVGQPCGVSMSQGRWRLYYSGRRAYAAEPFEGIGMALSMEGGTSFEGMPTQFKRRAMSAS